MVARHTSASKKAPAPLRGNYFAGERAVEFVSTGCTVLDCVLGGGWPLGRIVNIVGDKAVGKTLLAIEACANFANQYPRGHIWYREAEAAFDVDYAEELGLPVTKVDFGPDGIDSSWDTIEDIAEDLEACAAAAKKSGQPGLYIIDSLDAVSSRAEGKRKVGDGTYGLEKQKEMGRIFRSQVRALKAARVALIVVSQIRDRIGVTFGDKYTRTGGKALDFYASQILWLHHMNIIKSTRGGVERPTGVRIRAKCKKNKIAASFRECEFVLLFGFGTDDIEASLKYLLEVDRLDALGLKKADVPKYLREAAKLDSGALRVRQGEVAVVVRGVWRDVEDRFRPRQKKYGQGAE